MPDHGDAPANQRALGGENAAILGVRKGEPGLDPVAVEQNRDLVVDREKPPDLCPDIGHVGAEGRLEHRVREPALGLTHRPFEPGDGRALLGGPGALDLVIALALLHRLAALGEDDRPVVEQFLGHGAAGHQGSGAGHVLLGKGKLLAGALQVRLLQRRQRLDLLEPRPRLGQPRLGLGERAFIVEGVDLQHHLAFRENGPLAQMRPRGDDLACDQRPQGHLPAGNRLAIKLEGRAHIDTAHGHRAHGIAALLLHPRWRHGARRLQPGIGSDASGEHDEGQKQLGREPHGPPETPRRAFSCRPGAITAARRPVRDLA